MTTDSNTTSPGGTSPMRCRRCGRVIAIKSATDYTSKHEGRIVVFDRGTIICERCHTRNTLE